MIQSKSLKNVAVAALQIINLCIQDIERHKVKREKTEERSKSGTKHESGQWSEFMA